MDIRIETCLIDHARADRVQDHLCTGRPTKKLPVLLVKSDRYHVMNWHCYSHLRMFMLDKAGSLRKLVKKNVQVRSLVRSIAINVSPCWRDHTNHASEVWTLRRYLSSHSVR